MLTLKCSKCGAKLIKYQKPSRGRVLRCWFSRIVEDYTVRKDDMVYCKCGNRLGRADNLKINMKQGAFKASGTYG